MKQVFPMLLRPQRPGVWRASKRYELSWWSDGEESETFDIGGNFCFNEKS